MEPAEDPEEEPSLAETDANDGAHKTPKHSEVSRLSFNSRVLFISGELYPLL